MSEGVRTGKVVHVIGALIAGGAETFVVSLLTLLARHMEVELLVLSPRADDKTRWLRARLAEANVAVHAGPTERVGLGTVRWYRRCLIDSAPTAVHLHTPNTELIHACAGFSWATGFDLFRTVHSAQPEQRMLMKLALRLNRAGCSIAVGDAVREILVRGPYQSPFRTIRNGVAFGPVPKPEDRKQARARLGLAPDSRIYLSVGRMSASTFAGLAKAQDVLLDAWRMFVTEIGADESGQAELHLLGDGNLRVQLAANQPASVFFHGVQPDVTDWLLACDWFVMPSRFEGLPIAGIEAVGYGAHCIFSGIAPLRELSPRAAIWVDAGSVTSLLEGLRSSMQASVQPVDTEWLNEFRNRYGLEQTAAAYLKLYQSAQENPGLYRQELSRS